MRIGGTTAVYGVIGDPVSHSLSPRMQNRAMEAMGLDAVYVAFRVTPDGLGDAFRAFRALSIRGLNVTVPHKTAVIPFLDRLTVEAESVGAVNTVIRDGDALVGDNTDVHGFLMCVLEDCGIGRFPERVCVLGAGGAARGILCALAGRPEVKEIAVVNRTLTRATELVDRFSLVTGARITAHPAEPAEFRKILPDAGMIVNTTTVGMTPDIERSPIPEPETIGKGQIVCDIIYTPVRTKLLRDAEARGARTVGGIGMLAHQGARSLGLWTGREAPIGLMREELERALAGNN